MQIEQTDILVSTPDGQMPAFLCRSSQHKRQPAVVLLMEAFGLTAHIREIATRIAKQGYVVLSPDLYYRELPNNKFGYAEVESAMATMYRLDFHQAVVNDIRATLAYIKSLPDVEPDRIGVTGFCLGGGLTFMCACQFSNEIAAAAPFYGMVLDEWIEAMTEIQVPMHLFFGGRDPFIPRERVEQIESRLKALNKEYTLQFYPDADHGFFCHERSSYNPSAAEDAWIKLMQFFQQHLKEKGDRKPSA
ncbi:dienelactone hydrolase family protein [Desertifilum sp. FACHB-1129]|uniref:Dienelactone hydrolase n=2 Tax=Desertifilum tharense IPPAS B-1220 TaxID=1781255 RepID=A0A1E5QMD7_9CYAN|nr:dienelactone hydrolase family protein [Desertifilum tharense]MBD2313341.1 dienelactone hydrolase family protein [Desertifilum sp. FACHB-1129]MBD2324412.1 dienelactone hydrolase family protein [Desertifilum sp. FACHB-866]MBD2334426.1 dienelactone hydrolase family protein [Desertifilum sp. FACHB-868]MDA0212729.1 dienelactone hydrolase family protein [Cyanobacteria bacterium FC1]OEJ75862.1 dienelactone hydrolase [Desertifilum tharense IPPAS B-1220]